MIARIVAFLIVLGLFGSGSRALGEKSADHALCGMTEQTDERLLEDRINLRVELSSLCLPQFLDRDQVGKDRIFINGKQLIKCIGKLCSLLKRHLFDPGVKPLVKSLAALRNRLQMDKRRA